jgi:hypothetical protein
MFINIFPPVPPTAVPLLMEIDPELPLVVKPVLNSIEPLPLVGPEFAVLRVTIPLHDALPSPLLTKIAPPVDAVLDPAASCM